MTINLRAERLNRGLSAAQAAEKMGLKSAQVLLNAENGSDLRPGTAKKIADFYGYRVTQVWPVGEVAA